MAMTYVAVVIAKNCPGAQGEHRPGIESPVGVFLALLWFLSRPDLCVRVHVFI